ncbi:MULTISPECIES: hypothetical protein [Priestia]|jgi:hypothetical protein|uniref:hypothetical protein n=1 Tax=Priestia TaxID=2800373 RepID=UPI00203F8DE2|nr:MULTISPECIES: hypothetical protein [Priestia]MCM3770168.1 hypothetical protein [Priestia aryabhattai]MDY0942264.1 hypothetical protein [Priestia megaterium]
MNKIRVYTLVDGSERTIKIKKRMTLREEMNILGIRESDILHIKLISEDKNRRLDTWTKTLNSSGFYRI